MDLGSTIYKLRTAKNLSQEELAGLLEVSRQSVSKWETNAATPDLEKLIKLCDIFDVSLDDLAGRSKPEPKEPVAAPVKNPALSQRKIAGCLLLGLSIVAALLFLFLRELFYGTVWFWFLCVVPPLFCCSLVCLSDKAYTGYRCFWLTAIFTNYAFFELVAIRFLRGKISLWNAHMLVQLFVVLVGIFAARCLLGGVSIAYQKKRWYLFAAAWVGYVLLSRFALKLAYSNRTRDLFGNSASMYAHFFACMVLAALLAILLTATYLHLRSWWEHKKTT